MAQIASSDVSARISTRPAPPSRSARSFTCAADSSPVTSSARRSTEIARERHQQQRRLADSGLTADQDERGGDEPAAEHTVELGEPCRDPLGGFDLDLVEAERGARLAARRSRELGGRLLDERPEGAAARAAPEPAGRGLPALRAGKFDRSLPHTTSLGSKPDALCVKSVPISSSIRPTDAQDFPLPDLRPKGQRCPT